MLANDIRNLRRANYIAHSWGKKPEQKEAERKYNHEYYMKHKKDKGTGKQIDEATSGVGNFATGGLIGVAGGFISDMMKSDKEKEIANVPCNVLIYNDSSDTDPNGSKYIAKVKIETLTGKQYWKYFYTDYQVECYNNLIKKVTDIRDNSEQSNYLNSKFLDNVDLLLMNYDFKKEPCSMEEDIKAINPNYDDYNRDTSNNCIYCTEAYMLRQMGFDVKAVEQMSSDSGESADYTDFRSEKDVRTNTIWNPEITVNDYSNDYSDIERDVKKYGDGAYGNISMYAMDIYGNIYGHSIVWQNKDGKTYFIDTQDSNRSIETSLEYYNDYGYSAFSHFRGDNQIPDGRLITKHVQPANKVNNWAVSDKEKYNPGIFERLLD